MENPHIYIGNTSRFHAVLDKAGKGKTVSIVFLGASVTYAYLIEKRHQFTTIVTNYFQDMFPDADIVCHNISLPGMSSLHGLNLSYFELEQYSPDLIVIDYSVNDQKNKAHRDAFESLITRCLSFSANSAVMCFFLKKLSGYTCTPQMAAVCEHYGVPYVNIGTWLDEDIALGKMRWENFSYDDCHPGPFGQGYIGKCLIRLLDELFRTDISKGKNTDSLPQDGLFSRDLAFLNFYPGSWEHTPELHPAPLEFDAACHTLFAAYSVNTSEDYGTACLYVDGAPCHTFTSYRVHEWAHPAYEIIYLSKETNVHRISLQMLKGESNKYFHLLCLGYV